MKCDLCPRQCKADRETSYGYCGAGRKMRIARAALHYWEEPCISGKNGSGAVFFTGCALRCVYCQNHEISFCPSGGKELELPGREIGVPELIDIFNDLKEQGAHNINLVTGDHFIPDIAAAVSDSKMRGFDLPFIFNCSGYETVESLRILEGLIDVYLTDYKYEEKELAKALSNAENYPETVKAALSEMVRQQPVCEYDGEGMLKKGVIVRNLLLPKHVMNSKKILKYLFEVYGGRVIISIMSQYTPNGFIPDEFPYLKRRVTRAEYERLTDYALKLGIENAYIQDITSFGSSFIPEFGDIGQD